MNVYQKQVISNVIQRSKILLFPFHWSILNYGEFKVTEETWGRWLDFGSSSFMLLVRQKFLTELQQQGKSLLSLIQQQRGNYIKCRHTYIKDSEKPKQNCIVTNTQMHVFQKCNHMMGKMQNYIDLKQVTIRLMQFFRTKLQSKII